MVSTAHQHHSNTFAKSKPILPISNMPIMAVFSSFLAPFHLFAYSTLLGTQLYQTFVMVKIAHRALPRDAFTTLQKRVFPAYFRSQSLLLALVAVTLPPHGPMSLAREKADWISFLVAGVTAALNLVVFGPRTSRIMMVRKYQGMPLTMPGGVLRSG